MPTDRGNVPFTERARVEDYRDKMTPGRRMFEIARQVIEGVAMDDGHDIGWRRDRLGMLRAEIDIHLDILQKTPEELEWEFNAAVLKRSSE